MLRWVVESEKVWVGWENKGNVVECSGYSVPRLDIYGLASMGT
jgi:hypothetical protein